MKVLVTGVNGQLGWEVAKHLRSLQHEVIGADMEDFDLANADAVMAFVVAHKPEVIVHCGAYTSVDQAETEPEVCCRVNGMGTLNLVRAALRVDATLAYISTDYVFNGTGEEPYETNAPRRPLNIYGQSKMQGEEAVQSLMSRFFIIRTSWLYGAHGANYIQAALNHAGERRELTVASDQIGAPTYAPDLAKLIGDMIRTNRYGVYHAANAGYCSRADAAQTALSFAGRRAKLRPAPTEQVPGKAHRPLNSRLSMTSLDEAGFARLPDWKSGLIRYLDEL